MVSPIVPVWLVAQLFLQQELPLSDGLPETVRAGVAREFAVVEGPHLLAEDLELQWGGQNFSYFLEGRDHLFWTGLRYRGEDAVAPPVIGQFPKHPDGSAATRTELPINFDNVSRVFQPLLLRTPDGHLHVFVGSENSQGKGHVDYFRSRRPEEVTELVALGRIDGGEFAGFHLRMNVALSKDGERMALVVLSCYEPGKHLINTPLLVVGHRDGLDFRFDRPRVITDPLRFFYPLVAATEFGVVMIGAVSNDDDTHRSAVLMHVDWDGQLRERHDLPPLPEPGKFSCHALQPIRVDDWSRVVFQRSLVPDQGRFRSLEFWEYSVVEQSLVQRRSIRNDIEVARSITNGGELLPRRDGPPVFFNNPASQAIHVWEGDLWGDGEVRFCPFPETDPGKRGSRGTRSIYLPNVLQGAVLPDDAFFLAADVTNPDMQKGHRGPCSLLTWRIRSRFESANED